MNHRATNCGERRNLSLHAGSERTADRVDRKTEKLRARLAHPDALLSRTDLRDFGLERRAVDAVFRALSVIVMPSYSRPLVRVTDYLELLERSTYAGDRVR
jgi:hypothetical protein